MKKIKIIKKLTDKGFPTHDHNYHKAHRIANKVEKKDDPKEYNLLKKKENKLGKHELMGKNLKSGRIEVEKKFSKPKRLKNNIIIHEKTENKILTALSRKNK